MNQNATPGMMNRADLEKAVQAVCLEAAEAGLLQSAHDCSDGGLAVALAESSFSSLNRPAFGVEVELQSHLATPSLLFSESPSRIIISFASSDEQAIRDIAASHDSPYTVIGRVAGDALRITANEKVVVNEAVSRLESVWRSALPRKLQADELLTIDN